MEGVVKEETCVDGTSEDMLMCGRVSRFSSFSPARFRSPAKLTQLSTFFLLVRSAKQFDIAPTVRLPDVVFARRVDADSFLLSLPSSSSSHASPPKAHQKEHWKKHKSVCFAPNW